IRDGFFSYVLPVFVISILKTKGGTVSIGSSQKCKTGAGPGDRKNNPITRQVSPGRVITADETKYTARIIVIVTSTGLPAGFEHLLQDILHYVDIAIHAVFIKIYRLGSDGLIT